MQVRVEGQSQVRPIVVGFGGGEFLATTLEDYTGYVSLLQNVWGFESCR